MLTDSYYKNLSVFRKHFAEKNKQLPNKRKRVYAISAVAVMLIAVITSVALFVPFNITDEDNTKKYLASNRGEMVSSIEELNNNTISLNIYDLGDYQINKYYDKKYNDTLYFTLYYDNKSAFNSITITVVTNKDYIFLWQYDNLDDEKVINSLVLKYREIVSVGDPQIGLYYIQSYGKIDCGTEQVYIEYSGISLDGTSDFVELVESMIVPK